MHYTTVFDVTQVGFRQWTFPAFGLIFIVIGLVLPTLLKHRVLRSPIPGMDKWFPPIWLGFAIIWTVTSFISTFGEYRRAVAAMRDNRAQIVEGVVTQFKPMPYIGHSMESFTVQGVKFEYSDYVAAAGFNQTASHGGPIHEGLPVKIWYDHGQILRLDVKNPESETSGEAGGLR